MFNRGERRMAGHAVGGRFAALTAGLAAVFVVLAGGRVVVGSEPSRREVGQVVLDGVPEVPAALRERMSQYLNVRAASFLDFDETGERVLISTRFGNTEQLHVVTQPGGARRQITFLDEPVRGGAFLPGSGGRKLFYLSDRGGSENNQIYLLDLDEGKSRMLTDGKSRHEQMIVARNGKRIAFTGTGRNGRDNDIYVADGPEFKPRLAMEVSGAFYPLDFSPDGKLMSVLEMVSVKESYVHLLSVESGKATLLTPKSPPRAHGGGKFSADGKQVFLTSDKDGQFQALYRRNLSDGSEVLVTGGISWDIESIAVSPKGDVVAFTSNEDGRSVLYTMKADGMKFEAVDGIPLGLVGGLEFSSDGRMLGMTLNSPSTPGDVYTLSLSDRKLSRWTESEVGGLNAAKFVMPERFSYPTFDDAAVTMASDDMAITSKRMIPAYYYKPQGKGPFPVVVYIHGGPEGQERPRFSSLFQYWAAEMGVAVIIPNVRGSMGYGRDYHMLDDAMKREDSVKDIGALLDWIGGRPELDAKRVAVYGGSYGGYMVLACLTNYPGRIKAGVDIVGIANFITFLEKTAPYRQDLRRVEYGDERDPAMRAVFEKISPLNNAERITAALYVQHGANDPRVPAYEAEQIVEKLRAKGHTVWYMLAKDEGHGFAKKENRDLATLTSIMFLEEQIGG